MTLEFDINETGTFNVEYDASISIPDTTATVVAGKITLHPPVGDYTIYSVTVTNTVDSNCTYTYNPDIEIECLAPCGCGTQNFSVLSVTNTSESVYTVIFDACRVNPIHAEVFNGGSVIAVTGVATRSYVNNNAWLHKTSQNSTVPTGTFVFGDLDDAGQSVTFGCHYTSLGLTSAEHVLLNTRINTLMTAVGR